MISLPGRLHRDSQWPQEAFLAKAKERLGAEQHDGCQTEMCSQIMVSNMSQSSVKSRMG